MDNSNFLKCKELAKKVRIHCLKMVHRSKSAHIGSMLSMADLLVVLYECILNIDPKNPKNPNRDRFILSKGHGGAALYAVLAEKGFIPLEWLNTYCLNGGKLSGHISHHINGVEFSTGSLGHGLSVALGMALAAKQKRKNHRIFCLVGDGDCNEGSTWEAIMLAGQYKLDNFITILDYNKLQALGKAEDILNLEPFEERIRLCRWAVKTINGHNYEEIYNVLSNLPLEKDKPSWIIANTIKGKGVSFMENDYRWHYGGLTDELLIKAIKEIESNYEKSI